MIVESWIIYGLVAGLFIGISNFYSKVVAHKNINKERIFLYSSLSHVILSGLYLFFYSHYIELSIILILLIIVRIITAIEKNLFIVEGLKYIETSLFYPVHKTIHIFLSLLVGMIFFGEYLNLLQGLGLCLGIFVILLLTDKENRKIQIDYKKGLWFLALSNVMILISSVINKYIAHIDFSIANYMLLSGTFGTLYILFTKKQVYEKTNKKKLMEELKIGFFKGTLTLIGFCSFMIALKQGPFVLVQMMNTSSIFIPIILSTLLYNEKITGKKIGAFILFIGVIYFVSL